MHPCEWWQSSLSPRNNFPDCRRGTSAVGFSLYRSARHPHRDAMAEPDVQMLLERVVVETATASAEASEARLSDAARAKRVAAALQLDAPARNQAFLGERDLVIALGIYLSGRTWSSADDIRSILARDIAYLDRAISRQLNAVLHHPQFQKLEGTWRGLQYLVCEAEPDRETTRILLMHLTWRELERDLEMASEFDQSTLFQRIYTEEYGVLGGEPFGLLLGDYEIHSTPTKEHPYNDVAVLSQVAQVAAAAYAPFVTAAHPSLLGLSSFMDLSRQLDLVVNQEAPEMIRWKSLRASEDARFLTLVLPRMLMRLPYASDGKRSDGFVFDEDMTQPNGQSCVWGSAIWAFGATVVRAFRRYGWFADIKGVRRGELEAGLAKPVVLPEHGTDQKGIATKSPLEVVVTENVERDLSSMGLVALCPCKDTPYIAFYSSQSIQMPRVYDKAEANANARISAMTSYMLCVSRVAHHLKVMARNKIGSFQEAKQLESYMNNWLTQWVSATANINREMRARFPLRAGEVHVRESPRQPGTFLCEMHLEPHYQFEEMTTQMVFNTRFEGGSGA